MPFKCSSAVELFTKTARDFLSDDFGAVDSDETIGAAIEKIQKNKKSTLLITQDDKLRGIITEQDIARRLMFTVDANDPVSKYMTSPVIFIYEYDLLFHAIGKMRQAKLRHLPVVTMDEKIIGIINLHDALAAELGDAIGYIDNITFDKDEQGIRALKEKQSELADGLLADRVNAFDISYLLSFLNVVIYRRSIRLAIARNEKKNLIEKVPDFCVLVMGSGGRMESFLHPDQDNGIIYDVRDTNINDKEKIDLYFLELAKEFTQTLNFAGIPLCKGDLMATNRLWRHSLADWKLQVDDWIKKSNDNTLRYMDMLYDFQSVFGKQELAEELRDFLLKRLGKTPQFLKYLSHRDAGTDAAINFFGRFILEKEDEENYGLLNLKHTGTLPLVESIRMYAIKHKVNKVSTIERLEELTKLKVFSAEEFDFFKNALEFLSGILMKHQVTRSKQNKPVQNYIDPKKLLPRETKLLKIYLKEIKKLKVKVRGDFGEEYV